MADEQLRDRLNLYSVNDLEFRLGIARDELYAIAATAGSHYSPFKQTKKPRPFQKITKPPKSRDIDNPTGRIKWIQARINRRLLKPLVLPNYLCGGVKGKMIIDNVMTHLNARALVTLDIKSFFPSIDNRQVFRVWRELLNCSPRISSLLTRLTTFERHLPQGAPTSTLLANLVLYSVDEPIREECRRLGITYSTWVDDLAFSGDAPEQVIDTAVKALRAGGFAISHKKLRMMRSGNRKVLNGVVLGRIPGIPQETLSRIRSGLHKLRTGQVPRNEVPKYVRSLEGKVQHVSGLAPRKAEKLNRDLDIVKKEIALSSTSNVLAAY